MNNNKKKKGRKPSAKIYTDLNNITQINECYIAHIPITLNDIHNYNDKKKNKKLNISGDNTNNNIKNINNSNNSSINDIKNINNNFSIKYDDNICIKKNKTDNIQVNNDVYKKVLDENKKLKLLLNKLNNNMNDNIILHKCNIEYNNDIKKNKDLVCWWCCNSFNNDPVYLPECYMNNTYNVIGYFCSFNCALAYNVDLNDSNIWKRYKNLNKLYYDIYNKYTKIIAAPTKYCLKQFGGSINIDEFRKKSLIIDKQYRFIVPPLKPIVSSIEEKHINVNNKDTNKIFNIIKKNYILQREKPLVHKNNSIQKAMNLKIN